MTWHCSNDESFHFYWFTKKKNMSFQGVKYNSEDLVRGAFIIGHI